MLKEPYKELLDALVKSLERHFDLISVVVFGSVARGEAGKDSDIDLLIVADNLPDRYERFKLFERAEGDKKVRYLLESLRREGYNLFLSPIIKSREEASVLTPLYLDMVEDAVIIYDKGNFFSKILERLRKRLVELEAERIRIGKNWYWRLKKDYRFGEVIRIE